MPILREGSPGRLPEHAPAEGNPLQELLDTNSQLAAEFTELEDRAAQLDEEINVRQRALKEIGSRQREITKQQGDLIRPKP